LNCSVVLLFYFSSLKGKEVCLRDYHAVSVLLGSGDNINCASPHFSAWLLFCVQIWSPYGFFKIIFILSIYMW